jgi:cyclophilin family peptidyl-prolyl cis-trans isomerase
MMLTRVRTTLALAAVLTVVACVSEDADRPATTEQAEPAPRVVVETTEGRIVLELDPERAPRTTRNFLAHVHAGFYDGLIFHRVKPRFIQAGYYTPDMRRARSSADPVYNESDNGRRNLRGTIAMARTDHPHTAIAQFFINAVDNPMFDYDSTTERWGYAVFGDVVEGLDVVDAIAAVPTERRGSNEAVPLAPIVIEQARIVEPDTT